MNTEGEKFEFEQNTGVQSTESRKWGMEEAKKLATEVKEIITPFVTAIETVRKAHPTREVGGRIHNGKLEWFDESKWEETSVSGESYESERKLAEAGTRSFHSHPEGGLTNESGMDILAAYYRLCETVFHDKGATILVALKKLSVDEIHKIEENAWKTARADEEKSAEPAYWLWKGLLQEELPLHKEELLNSIKK